MHKSKIKAKSYFFNLWQQKFISLTSILVFFLCHVHIFVAICLLFNNSLRMLLKKTHISHICLASGDLGGH